MNLIKIQKIPKLLLILSVCFFYCEKTALSFQDTLSSKPIIIIDPGHGGSDNGAESITGLNEKDFNLYLVFAIKNKLKKDFKISITRNSDYFLSSISRANFANSESPQIFISIHSGALFSQNISGNILIGYCRMDSDGTQEEPSMFSAHKKYTKKSLELAKSFYDSISRDKKKVKIISAPFLSLSTLNMPAVIIEIGNLNSPADSLNMKKPEFIDKIADSIADGIRTYFKNNFY